jgi:hypothetical protein
MAISQSIMPDNIGPAKSLLTPWWPAQMSACIGLHVLAWVNARMFCSCTARQALPILGLRRQQAELTLSK